MIGLLINKEDNTILTIVPDVMQVSDDELIAVETQIKGINAETTKIVVTSVEELEVGSTVPTDLVDERDKLSKTKEQLDAERIAQLTLALAQKEMDIQNLKQQNATNVLTLAQKQKEIDDIKQQNANILLTLAKNGIN